MKATRRRARAHDPLASPTAVRAILNLLRERCAAQVPRSEKHVLLLLLLESIRHIERKPAIDTRRGQPSGWQREDLLSVAAHLRTILERETGGRVALSSFVGQYVRILHFPTDVVEVLSVGDVNMMEAAQLARLTSERLGCSPAVAIRRELPRSHTALQGSQNQLRAQVKELLGEGDMQQITGEAMRQVIGRVDEMLEIDPTDTRHLFWEEIKRIFYAMRDIEPEDLDEDLIVAWW